MKDMFITLKGSAQENPKEFISAVITCVSIFTLLIVALSI